MAILQRTNPLLFVKMKTDEGGDFRLATDRLLSFKFKDSDRKADVAELTVDNSDLSNFDDPAWRKGRKITVRWGYPGAMSPERLLVVTSVKGFKQLKIEAQALSVLMNRITKSRTFQNKSISQIATQIAQENGYGTQTREIEDTGDVFDTIAQAKMTDAQFLRRWASRVGFEFYVDHKGFHFHSRKLSEPPVRRIIYHSDPQMGDVIGEPSIENDITAKPGRVKVKGRDPKNKKDIEASADNDSDSDREVLTEKAAYINPETSTITRGRRPVESTVSNEDVVASSDADEESANKRAKGRYRRAQQTAIKMSMSIVGDPLLTAKTIVSVEGMGKRLSVKYYVKEIVHELGTSGYSSNLKLISDGHGGHSTKSQYAEGLGLFESDTKGGASDTKNKDAQLLDLLTELASNAGKNNDPSFKSLEKIALLYGKKGNAASDECVRVLAAVSTNPNVNKEIKARALQIKGQFSQLGQEQDSGGRKNDKEVREDTDELEQVGHIDGDTGRLVTRFKRK